MKELGELKAQAHAPNTPTYKELHQLFDRAIAIAEQWKDEYHAADDDAQQYRALNGELITKRDKARAAVLALRNAIDAAQMSDMFSEVLAVTEWLEQHRESASEMTEGQR